MKKFIIIDFEIKSYVGHYFTLADNIAKEAYKRGYEVSVLTNTEFSKFTKDVTNKNYTVYPIGSLSKGDGINEGALTGFKKFIKKTFRFLVRGSIKTIIRFVFPRRHSFNLCCGLTSKSTGRIKNHFAENPIDLHDIILFQTYTPESKCILEVLSILNKNEVQSKISLYLHNFPKDGFKRQFKKYLNYYKQLDDLNINYYATTQGVASSYNNYLMNEVKTLPYIDNKFQINHEIKKDHRKICICYIGAAWQRKGYVLLPQVINLPSNYLTYLEFVFQSNAIFELPVKKTFKYLSNISLDNIWLLENELSSTEYIDLFSKADIILCLYSRCDYYFKASGIFNEAISHGIPVFLTAGTYMHFEIVRVIHQNNLKLKKKVKVIDTFNLLKDKQLNKAISLNFNNLLEHKGVHNLFFHYSYEKNKTFDCLELTVIFYYKRKICHKIKELLAPGIDILEGSFLVKNPINADKMKVRISNLGKFDNVLLKTFNMDIWSSKEKLPLSSIAGVVYDTKDIQLKLQDMIDFSPHYRSTCKEFSKSFSKRHSVEHFLKIIEGTN